MIRRIRLAKETLLIVLGIFCFHFPLGYFSE